MCHQFDAQRSTNPIDRIKTGLGIGSQGFVERFTGHAGCLGTLAHAACACNIAECGSQQSRVVFLLYHRQVFSNGLISVQMFSKIKIRNIGKPDFIFRQSFLKRRCQLDGFGSTKMLTVTVTMIFSTASVKPQTAQAAFEESSVVFVLAAASLERQFE